MFPAVRRVAAHVAGRPVQEHSGEEDDVSDVREPIGDPDDEGGQQADFAGEHDDTAVDEDITTGDDAGEREPESPRGWAGLEP
jgi:hypothetical protein